MKQTLINKITMCLLLSGMNNFAWSMESRSMGNRYTVGEWDNDSVSSHGISMMASSNGNSAFKETSLVDLKDLRKCFFKGWLEITSDNYECLLQYSEMHETAFNNYDRGVFIKQWKASLGADKLLDLLFKFTHITKFKLDVMWDQDDVDMAETISRSVQFFPSLTELTIAKCRLTDGGMTDVMESIESPALLRILDVRDNPLSEGILLQIREFFTNLTDFKTDLMNVKEKALSPETSGALNTSINDVTGQNATTQIEELKLIQKVIDEKIQTRVGEKFTSTNQEQVAPTEEWLAAERIRRRPEFDQILLRTGLHRPNQHRLSNMEQQLITIYENQTNITKNLFPLPTDMLSLNAARLVIPGGSSFETMLWVMPMALIMNNKIKGSYAKRVGK